MKVKVSRTATQVLQYKRKVGEMEEENIKMRDQVGFPLMPKSNRECTTCVDVCLQHFHFVFVGCTFSLQAFYYDQAWGQF